MTRPTPTIVIAILLTLSVGCSTRTATVLGDAAVVADQQQAEPDAQIQADALPADLGVDQVVHDTQGCMLVSDTYTQTLNRKVDVLFVVDTGGSMLDERPRILATAPVFASAASTHNLDYHIGFIAVSELTPRFFPNIPLGQLLGTPAYLDNASSSTLQAEMESRLKLGSSTGKEWGLDAIKAALSAPFAGTVSATCTGCATPNQCVSGACRGPNWGFHRNDASLEIIVFTDEDDSSPNTSAAQAVAYLKSLVDPASGTHVRVHAVIPQGTTSCGQLALAWATIASQTGGDTGNLCATDYAPIMNSLASRIFGLKDQFFLTRKPTDPSGVYVLVDGKDPANVTYDGNSNSVSFAKAPAEGSDIRIMYKVCD